LIGVTVNGPTLGKAVMPWHPGSVLAKKNTAVTAQDRGRHAGAEIDNHYSELVWRLLRFGQKLAEGISMWPRVKGRLDGAFCRAV
jgi:hypothetical protein